MRLALPVLTLLLASCGDGAGRVGAASGSTPRVGIVPVPDAGGLGIAGSAQRIDFGRSPAGVIPVLDRELGPGRALAIAGCSAGIETQMAWGDLVLTFTDEQFVGWRGPSGAGGQVCDTRA